MSEPTPPDRLVKLQKEELERVFPDVVTSVKALCSGDPLALLSGSFEDRAREWKHIENQYAQNSYLGNYFSDIIRQLHDIKQKAYRFESAQKQLAKNYRTYFKEIPDGITIDLLVALLINRCYETPTRLHTGFNIRAQAQRLLQELTQANDEGVVMPGEEITLDYLIRAILKKQLIISAPAETKRT